MTKKISVWRSNPELMDRLSKAQNRRQNSDIDIMTFAAFCETPQELECHVAYYEGNK